MIESFLNSGRLLNCSLCPFSIKCKQNSDRESKGKAENVNTQKLQSSITELYAFFYYNCSTQDPQTLTLFLPSIHEPNLPLGVAHLHAANQQNLQYPSRLVCVVGCIGIFKGLLLLSYYTSIDSSYVCRLWLAPAACLVLLKSDCNVGQE